MVPRSASNSSIRSALLASSESRYSNALVSKNESASLIRFESIELEGRRQPAAVLPQPRQQFARAGGLRDLEDPFTRDLNFQHVAYFHSECLDDGRGQSGRQTITPFGDLHGAPLRYTLCGEYIQAARRLQNPRRSSRSLTPAAYIFQS